MFLSNLRHLPDLEEEDHAEEECGFLMRKMKKRMIGTRDIHAREKSWKNKCHAGGKRVNCVGNDTIGHKRQTRPSP